MAVCTFLYQFEFFIRLWAVLLQHVKIKPGLKWSGAFEQFISLSGAVFVCVCVCVCRLLLGCVCVAQQRHWSPSGIAACQAHTDRRTDRQT